MMSSPPGAPPRPRPARCPRDGRRLLAALGCVAVLAGCGSVPAGTGRPAAPKVSLVITVTPRPGAVPHRWTLRCRPVGGSHPHARAACRLLLPARRPFAPLPKGIMCAMIVSGPQRATIRGRWFGMRVDESYSQRDSCQTMRWHRLGVVLSG